ncbi:hypothetical protein RJ639_001160 [Escallonia herrerae]|uniref:PROP1-like PPR domain-containing protein n=1 Tax=Escallonia herrerae TaxID=1293975 RepID=A0AA89BN79_9ASTE|nr:hypothetical protein RJ639_001160 [Escallonia herrerae]
MLLLRKSLFSPSLSRATSRFLTTQIPNSIENEPSSAYYDRLIDAAGRERDFAAVHRLLNERARDGFFNTTETFKFISTHLSVLDDLLQTLARLDKGFPRTDAHKSLIARLAKMGRADEALRVADAMTAAGCGINASTFHPILQALTKKKEIDRAWRVVDRMREKNVSPDLTGYNYFLTSYCFVGDLTSAAGLLTKMTDEGMEGDARTYDALVLGACRTGKLDGALAVLRRTVELKVPLLYCTYAHVIGTMVRLGHYAQAVEFVKVCGGREKGLDSANFGLLASRLIDKKEFDEAVVILEEMSRRDLQMSKRLKDFYQLHTQK